MKKVYYIVAVILALSVLLGFVLPALMSAKADIAVLLGLGLMIFGVMVFLHFVHAKIFAKPVDSKTESK